MRLSLLPRPLAPRFALTQRGGPCLQSTQPGPNPGEILLDDCYATPDPPPIAVRNERVKASTRWIGSSKPSGITKRLGWSVGLYMMVTDDGNNPAEVDQWYRYLGEGYAGGSCGSTTTPLCDPDHLCISGFGCFERLDGATGSAGRPDLTYTVGLNGENEPQPVAHGLLQELGEIVAPPLRLIVRASETPSAPVIETYTWDGQARNDEMELVLTNAAGQPGARVCPVTRSVWIDETHPAGSTVWADYDVVPPPASPIDATDEIQRILESDHSVVLPEGTVYVRTSEHPVPPGSSVSHITIPENLTDPSSPFGIRGRDVATPLPDGSVSYERRSVLRAMPAGFPFEDDPVDAQKGNNLGGILVEQKGLPSFEEQDPHPGALSQGVHAPWRARRRGPAPPPRPAAEGPPRRSASGGERHRHRGRALPVLRGRRPQNRWRATLEEF